MKIEIEIDDDIIRNAIGGASIAHWANLNRGSWNRNTMRLVVFEYEDGAKTEILREHFENGVTILAQKYPHHFKDLIAQTGDAYTGNILVQCAAFGEVKYE